MWNELQRMWKSVAAVVCDRRDRPSRLRSHMFLACQLTNSSHCPLARSSLQATLHSVPHVASLRCSRTPTSQHLNIPVPWHRQNHHPHCGHAGRQRRWPHLPFRPFPPTSLPVLTLGACHRPALVNPLEFPLQNRPPPLHSITGDLSYPPIFPFSPAHFIAYALHPTPPHVVHPDGLWGIHTYCVRHLQQQPLPQPFHTPSPSPSFAHPTSPFSPNHPLVT